LNIAQSLYEKKFSTLTRVLGVNIFPEDMWQRFQILSGLCRIWSLQASSNQSEMGGNFTTYRVNLRVTDHGCWITDKLISIKRLRKNAVYNMIAFDWKLNFTSL
jgi:hypothetical protein